MLVFVVDADLVVEDGVEADVLEVGDLVDGANVVAIGLAEGEDGAAGAEDLFPEMGQRGGGGVGVNFDALGGLGVEGWGEWPRAEQSRKSESKPRVHTVQTPGILRKTGKIAFREQSFELQCANDCATPNIHFCNATVNLRKTCWRVARMMERCR